MLSRNRTTLCGGCLDYILSKAEQEDREIGDYDIHIEIEQDTAAKRVLDAEKFVERIDKYLQT